MSQRDCALDGIAKRQAAQPPPCPPPRKRIGRPPHKDTWKERHPAIRLKDLRLEILTILDFLVSQEDDLFRGFVGLTKDMRQDRIEDHRMAVQQAASRIDELHCVLHNLKLALMYQHPNPVRLL